MFTNIHSIFSASSYKKYTALIVSVIISLLCFQGISVSASSPQGSSVGERVVLNMAEVAVGLAIEGEVWAAETGVGEVPAPGNNALPGMGDSKATDGKSSNADDFWLKALNGGIDVLFSLLTPFLILAGWLLSPDWVFGEVFGLRPVLYDLWKLMSNIVYVAFAFLLIVMAFMNIYGGEKNAWAIKTKLPKLIIGVISVPFTWFFVSAIISISTILTASTIQLAGDLSKNTPSEFTFNVPTKCTLDFEGVVTGTGSAKKFYSCEQKDGKTDKKPQKLSELLMSDNPYGILSHYAYSVFRVDTLKNLTGPNLPTVKAVGDITMGLFIAILVFIIFMLITAMLILALFMRAIHFWMIAIFSPLLSLKYFLEDKMSFGEKWLSIPKIISLAMVPVYVSAALAFGLVFISAIGGAKMPTSEGTVVKIDGSKMTAFGTEYEVKGKPIWTGNNVNGTADKSLSGNVFGQLIIYFLALAVLWIAVTAAINSSEITKEAAQPVAEFGNQIGGIIKKLPQYAPIIPTKHGHASINSLSNIGSTIAGAIDSRGRNVGNEIGRGIADRLGVTSPLSNKHLKSENYVRGMGGNGSISSGPASTDALKKFIEHSQYKVDELGTTGAKENFKLLIDKINIPSTDKEELKKKISNFDGREDSLRAFLEDFNHKTGGKGDLNEVREYNELINKTGSSEPENSSAAQNSTTTAPSNQPIGSLQVTINGSPTQVQLDVTNGKPTKISDAGKADL